MRTPIKLSPMCIADFLTQKFLDWQQDSGEIKTVTDFGKLLGIGQAHMSMYLSGKRPPNAEHKKKIIDYYGDEAALVFGEDPDLYRLQKNWKYLEPETRRKLRVKAEQEANRKAKKNNNK